MRSTDALPGAAPTERTVVMHRDAVYEAQTLSPQPGCEPRLDMYLEAATAIAQKHGGQPLMAFEPVKALYGSYMPTLVRLLAWPDAETFGRLRRDPAYCALDPLFAEAVTESTVTLLRMDPSIHAEPEEVRIPLDDRLCYELSAFWDRPDTEPETWSAFIAAVTPSIERHGGHPLLVFQPLRCERGDFFPTRFCVAAWDTLEHFEAFIAAPEQQEIDRLRSLAVCRLDATATRLR